MLSPVGGELKKKITGKTAKVSVIGLGYVGLPLAIEIGKAGFGVVGIDIDKEKIDKINSKNSYVPDVAKEELSKVVSEKKLVATRDYEILTEADIASICVPTPLRKTREPDMSYIIAATSEVSKYLHRGQLIIVESTTFPGTTKDIILPQLEKRAIKVGKDFFLVFSPERVDPGNRKNTISNTPKVVGGITPECTEIAKMFYEQITEKVITVASTQEAEMTKLLENIFRSVNIALVNELTLMCDRLGIDIWNVIEAAATKPFGFMPFYPGPGVGGHCIPVDPIYLSWKAKTYGFCSKFIELAEEVNKNMPRYVVRKITGALNNHLNNHKKSINGSKILILGVAYKENVGDTRESPALDIFEMLCEKGAKVAYNDPYVPQVKIGDKKVSSLQLHKNLLSQVNCVVIATAHSSYDYNWIVENADLIVDTRNATHNLPNNDKIVKI